MICQIALTSSACYAIISLTNAAWFVLMSPDYSCEPVEINKELP